MANYSMSTYVIQLTCDFQKLEVKNVTTGMVAPNDSYDLDSCLSIKTVGSDYVISSANQPGNLYPMVFDSAEGDTISFDQARMGGVTIVRIESLQREFTFFLDVCPALLEFANGKLTIYSPKDENGTGPDPACVTVTEFSLESA